MMRPLTSIRSTRSHPLLVLVLLLLAVGCAGNRLEPPRAGEVMRGMASWYGEPFHGRATASGEIYDMHGLTAAHRELPLGTRAEVTNLDNGRKVRVLVNDRGPFVRGRILDLSFGAAKELDMVNAGLARVEIRVLEVGTGRPGPSLGTRFTVQLGAFQDRGNAERLLAKVRPHAPEAEIVTEEGWHRVRVGRFRDQTAAEQLKLELVDVGFSAFVLDVR